MDDFSLEELDSLLADDSSPFSVATDSEEFSLEELDALLSGSDETPSGQPAVRQAEPAPLRPDSDFVDIPEEQGGGVVPGVPRSGTGEMPMSEEEAAERTSAIVGSTGPRTDSPIEVTPSEYKELLRQKEAGDDIDLNRYALPSTISPKDAERAAALAATEKAENVALGMKYHKTRVGQTIAGREPQTPLAFAAGEMGEDPDDYSNTLGDVSSGLSYGPYGATAWLTGKVVGRGFHERLGSIVRESMQGIKQSKIEAELDALEKEYGVDRSELRKIMRMEEIRIQRLKKRQADGEVNQWGDEILSEEAYNSTPQTRPYERYRRMMYMDNNSRSLEEMEAVAADEGRWIKEVANQATSADAEDARDQFIGAFDADGAPKLSPEARNSLMNDPSTLEEIRQLAIVALQQPSKLAQELGAMIIEQGPIMLLTDKGISKILSLGKKLKTLQAAGKLSYVKSHATPQVAARFAKTQETKAAVAKTKETLTRKLFPRLFGEEAARDIVLGTSMGKAFESSRGRGYGMEEAARDFAIGLAFTGPIALFRTAKEAKKLTSHQFDQATRTIKTVAGLENMEYINTLMPMFHKLSNSRALDGRQIYIDPNSMGFEYFTADELIKRGYPEMAQGMKPGETRKLFATGKTEGEKITLHPIAGPDGVIEETAHYLQDYIRKMAAKEGGTGEFSSLQAMIGAWEESVRAHAKKMKLDIPQGDETFAQAFTCHMGYADQYSLNTRRLVLPEPILRGMAKLMGDDPVLRGQAYHKGDLTGDGFRQKIGVKSKQTPALPAPEKKRALPPPRDYDAEIKTNFRKANDKTLPQKDRVIARQAAKAATRDRHDDLEVGTNAVLTQVNDDWRAIKEHPTHDGLYSHMEALKAELDSPVKRSQAETAGLQKAYKRARRKLEEIKKDPGYTKETRPAYQLKPSDAGLQKKIENHFGTTRNMERAGYITPKGEMLDFSRDSKIRYQFHADVGELMDDTPSRWESVERFMDMGNVRLSPRMSAGMSLNIAPTSAQRQAMRNYIDNARKTESKFELEIQPGQELPVSTLNKPGKDRYAFHRIYEFPFDSRKILKDVDDFFRGEEPAPVSLAAQFHYQLKPIGGKLQNVRIEGKSRPRVRGIPEFAQDQDFATQKAAARRLYAQMDKYAEEGKAGKDWYEDSAEMIAYITKGNREDSEILAKFLAITSPQNTVPINAAQALKAFYNYKRQAAKGIPVSKMDLKFGVFPNKMEERMRAFLRGEDVGGRKVNSFHQNMMSHIDGIYDDKVTADLWMARAARFLTNQPGEGPKYDFIEGMVRDVAANRGWSPKQAQVAIWTAVKHRWEKVAPEVVERGLKKGYSEWVENTDKRGRVSRRIQVRDSKGAKAEFYQEMMKAYPKLKDDLDFSKYSFKDAFNEMEGRMTWEATPGKSTKHMRGIHEAPYEQRLAYTLDMFDALHDAHGRNIIFEELGLTNPAYHYAPGSWAGEVNPSIHFETYIPSKGGKAGVTLRQADRDALDAAAAALAYFTKQEGVGWHLPRFVNDPKKTNGLQLSLEGERAPTTENVKALEMGVRERVGDDFFENNMAYIPTESGPRFLYLDEAPIKGGNKPLSKQAFHDVMIEEAEKVLPDFNAKYYHAEGNLVTNNPPGVWDQGWEVHKNGEMFKQRIRDIAGSDILGRLEDVLNPKIRKVEAKYRDKHGWGGNRETTPIPENPPARIGESEGAIPATAYQLKHAADDPPPGHSGPGGQFFDVTPESRWDAFRRWAQDAMLPVARVQKDIEKSGGKIGVLTDTYGAEVVYHGRATARIEDANEKYFKPLRKFIKKHKITLKMLDDYSSAVFAPQRNAQIAAINPKMPDGGSGIFDADARVILQDFEGMGLTGKMEAARKMLRRINDERLRVMVEGGLINEETLNTWRQVGPDYVPLRGFEDMDAPEAGKMGISGHRGYGDFIKEKRALGRKSRAFSPTANSIAMLMDGIDRAEKNRVGQRFMKLVEENPHPDLWKIDKVEMKAQLDQNGQVVYKKKGFWPLEQNQFPVKVDGVQHVITIGDPHIANAMKQMGTSNMGGFIRSASFYNRMMAAINTSLSPPFILTNFLRDIQTAVAHAATEQSPRSAARVVKNTGFAIRGILLAEIGKGAGNKWVKAYNRYRAAGGKTGFFGLKGADEIRREIDSKLKGGVWGKAVGTKEALLGPIEKINTAVENGVRLAVFDECVNKLKMPDEKAAIIAKELTVNFNRKGEAGTVMNALYLFYNASLQGNFRMAGAMIKNPKLQKLAASATFASYVLAEYNRAVAGEDDSGMNRWDKVVRERPWEIERNLVLMDGDGTEERTRIPLPYGYNIFHVLGSSINDMVHGGNKIKSAANLALSSVAAFNPLGSSSSKYMRNAVLKTILPSQLQPGIQHVLNENFAGIPIKPEQSPFEPEKPASQMHFKSVRKSSKDFAQWLNRTTGGTIHRPGLIDPNPEIVDHYWDAYTGGAGKFAGRVVNLIYSAFNGEAPEGKEIPFYRVVRAGELEGVNRSRFYDIYQELRQYDADERVIRQHGNKLEKAKLRASGRAKQVATRMSQLGKRIREMEARGLPDGKIEKMRKQRDKISDQFLKWHTEEILQNKELTGR